MMYNGECAIRCSLSREISLPIRETNTSRDADKVLEKSRANKEVCDNCTTFQMSCIDNFWCYYKIGRTIYIIHTSKNIKRCFLRMFLFAIRKELYIHRRIKNSNVLVFIDPKKIFGRRFSLRKQNSGVTQWDYRRTSVYTRYMVIYNELITWPRSGINARRSGEATLA